MCIPKGVAPEKVAVLIDLLAYLLSKEAQATTYDSGYFYPGPAVKDVPLSMAPQESQDAVNSVRRDFIDKLITEVPSEVPLPADRLVFAFQRWDQQVGAHVGR
jgi:putative spermidine/putrescine transport system substrate-binding protein